MISLKILLQSQVKIVLNPKQNFEKLTAMKYEQCFQLGELSNTVDA